MTISRSNISKQLIPGLAAVLGQTYKNVTGEHLVLFEVRPSDRSFEEEVMMTGLGTAPVKFEGAAVQYDDMQESYTTRYQHETIALGFSITEEAMEDNLYENEGMRHAQYLGRSMGNTKETKAADVFNNGFDPLFPGGDGQSLFSTAHPIIGGGAQSNRVSSDLSETSLEQAVIDISLFKDERDILIGSYTKSLHIPSSQQFTAKKILESDMSTSLAVGPSSGITNVNDKNILKGEGFFPGGVHINHRFTDTSAWFIKTDCVDSTKLYERMPLSFKEEGDFDTGNLRYKARERYSFGYGDWRGWYGSEGAT